MPSRISNRLPATTRSFAVLSVFLLPSNFSSFLFNLQNQDKCIEGFQDSIFDLGYAHLRGKGRGVGVLHSLKLLLKGHQGKSSFA